MELSSLEKKLLIPALAGMAATFSISVGEAVYLVNTSGDTHTHETTALLIVALTPAYLGSIPTLAYSLKETYKGFRNLVD
jgi:hypothetical protein